MAAPNEVVTLYANPVGTTAAIYIGQTTTNSNGNWSLNTTTLQQGTYNIFAVARDPMGNITGQTKVLTEIDTDYIPPFEETPSTPPVIAPPTLPTLPPPTTATGMR